MKIEKSINCVIRAGGDLRFHGSAFPRSLPRVYLPLIPARKLV
jgi:hypothetical protein